MSFRDIVNEIRRNPEMAGRDDVLSLCGLALEALDGERARRVGEAVIEAVRKHDEEHLGAFGIDAIADDIGSDTNYMPHVEGAKILRAAAAALREEAK